MVRMCMCAFYVCAYLGIKNCADINCVFMCVRVFFHLCVCSLNVCVCVCVCVCVY